MTTRRLFSHFFGTLTLFVGGAATIAGCTASTTDAGDESEDALRKKPKATETWSNLTIALPTGSCQPGGICSRPLGAATELILDGSPVSLGAKSRVKPGTHTVVVNGASLSVTLAAGQSKTLTLAVAHRKCAAATLQTVPGTDFGKAVTLRTASCPTTASPTLESNGEKPTIEIVQTWWDCNDYPRSVTATLNSNTTASDCSSIAAASPKICSYKINGAACGNSATYPDRCTDTLDACSRYVRGDYSSFATAIPSRAQSFADYDLAYRPGSYEVTLDTGANPSKQQFSLAEGDTKEITVNLPSLGTIPQVFKTKIEFADPRELPDGFTPYIQSTCNDRQYRLPQNANTTLNLTAFQAPECTYQLNVLPNLITLDQSRANSITLHRLDVDDVEVTREDGSTYTVRGQYEIYFGGNRTGGTYNTNTGVDLAAATYELVTKFTTADGPQVQRETIQF